MPNSSAFAEHETPRQQAADSAPPAAAPWQRLRLLGAGLCLATLLAACGGGDGSSASTGGGSGTTVSIPNSTLPATPTGLAVAYATKGYAFTWTASPGADYYEMAEDPDGVGAQTEVAIGGSITATGYKHALTTLLHTRLNAQYRVRACNPDGCSAYSEAITPDLTKAIGYFKASNTDANDGFGFGFALSPDGNTLAVGAPGEDSNAAGVHCDQKDNIRVGCDQRDNSAANAGAVYVFTRSIGTWSQQAYLKASDAGAGDGFGVSLALSTDGDTLAVGATGAGAVYVFTRNGATWRQQAYLKASNTDSGDQFGFPVALSADGNTLAVGARLERSMATGVEGDQTNNFADSSGAVYVFTRRSGNWSQQAYVKASNTGIRDFFGESLALSGDGNTLAVGASGEDSNATGVGGDQTNNSMEGAGAVYVFTRNGATWSQQAYIKASNADQLDAFGASVTLSADGDTLAVGAPFERSNAAGVGGDQTNNNIGNGAGAVYLFTRSAGTWSQRAYLKASNPGPQDVFGRSVALSGDGNTLAVGATGEDSNATGVGGDQTNDSLASSGAVYVFTQSSGTWSQQGYLKASNTDQWDEFGCSVALSADGKNLVVGARGESSNATGMGGNQANNGTTNAGAVYVF